MDPFASDIDASQQSDGPAELTPELRRAAVTPPAAAAGSLEAAQATMAKIKADLQETYAQLRRSVRAAEEEASQGVSVKVAAAEAKHAAALEKAKELALKAAKFAATQSKKRRETESELQAATARAETAEMEAAARNEAQRRALADGIARAAALLQR